MEEAVPIVIRTSLELDNTDIPNDEPKPRILDIERPLSPQLELICADMVSKRVPGNGKIKELENKFACFEKMVEVRFDKLEKSFEQEFQRCRESSMEEFRTVLEECMDDVYKEIEKPKEIAVAVVKEDIAKKKVVVSNDIPHW